MTSYPASPTKEMGDWVTQSIIGIIITACVGLFVRVRQLESKRSAADVKIEALIKRDAGNDIGALERELHELRLCISDKYVRREDWVPTMSKILGALEKQAEMLARQDERLRHLLER